MKKNTFLLLLTLMSFTIEAQITLIPDQNFEQDLVYKGIDTDGVVNGQILTGDVLTVTDLSLGSGSIKSLIGIEAFINLEKLSAKYIPLGGYGGFLGQIDISTLTKLKELDLRAANLKSLDVTNNILLEKILVGNLQDIGDVWILNGFQKLDLSKNPNINYIEAFNLYTLEIINMRNNNAETVSIKLGNNLNEPYNVCIEVNDPVAATSGIVPYDNWVIDGNHYFNDKCTLSIEKFVNENFKIYPNPATNYVSVEQKITDGITLQSIQILDSSGKWIRSVKEDFNQIDVSNLSKGMYLFVIQTDKGNKTEKIIIK